MSSTIEASAAAAAHEPSSPTTVAAHHDHHDLNALVADFFAVHDDDIIMTPHRWHQECVRWSRDLHDTHGENDGGDGKQRLSRVLRPKHSRGTADSAPVASFCGLSCVDLHEKAQIFSACGGH